jgi:hypothetical protein
MLLIRYWGFLIYTARVCGVKVMGRDGQGDTTTRNQAADSFSATLRCHNPNGEMYIVNFSRQQVTISSYEDDAIRTRIETWADGVAALS